MQIEALTFDLFGTVLDLGGSLTPHIARFLHKCGSNVDPAKVWYEWRYRQRLEQYQDNIVAMGHSGYLPVVRRSGVYVMRQFKVDYRNEDFDDLMSAWEQLNPFADVLPALQRLKTRYKLVALSNGEHGYIQQLASNRIGWEFDAMISAESVDAFKPHPGVYRHGAAAIGLEVGQCMMVSANSYDVMGARMCGLRGAYVNRYDLPYEDTPFTADITVRDFRELADKLLA